MQNPFDPFGQRNTVANPPSASQRARDFLSAVRHEQQGDQADSLPAHLLPAAYVVQADESIDGEAAALALARQLAQPTDADDADRPAALLMIDPLGATLRLAGPAGDSAGPTRRVGPQRRVADRPAWDDLLCRLPRSVAALLVLDTTGQQHNLAATAAAASRPADDEEQADSVTVIIVARTGADGRVSGYRKLKEVVEHGAGQVGFFFVEDGQSASPPARTPLAERAQSTHSRLASTAEQFLNRHVFFFGATRDPNASAVRVEMLGQRPSLDRQENRLELTRWLADHARPLECDSALAARPPRLVTEEEMAELHTTISDAEPGVFCATGSLPASGIPGLPTDPHESQLDEDTSPDLDAPVPDVAPLPLASSQRGVASSSPSPFNGEGRSAVSAAERGEGPTAGEPHPAPLPLASSQFSKTGLAVIPVDSIPADDPAASNLLATYPQVLAADAAISFRRPTDRSLVLLYRVDTAAASPNGTGTLLLARPACGPAPLAGFANLVDSIDWAVEHWELIAQAHPTARLGPAPRIEAILILNDSPDEALKSLAARIPSLRLARLVPLNLSAVPNATAPLGLAIEPVRS